MQLSGVPEAGRVMTPTLGGRGEAGGASKSQQALPSVPPADPNTLFRSNSLASKSMEQFMKVRRQRPRGAWWRLLQGDSVSSSSRDPRAWLAGGSGSPGWLSWDAGGWCLAPRWTPHPHPRTLGHAPASRRASPCLLPTPPGPWLLGTPQPHPQPRPPWCPCSQLVGMPYLHEVLKPVINRVFEEKKYVELDPCKIDLGRTR